MIFVFAGCELDTDAFALARDADHTFSLASAHEQAAVLHQLRDEPTVVLDHAATALEMARAQGFGPQVAIAQILWGWSHAALGEPQKASTSCAPGSRRTEPPGPAWTSRTTSGF